MKKILLVCLIIGLVLLIGCRAKVESNIPIETVEEETVTPENKTEEREVLEEVPDEWKNKTIKDILGEEGVDIKADEEDIAALEVAEEQSALPSGTHIVELRKIPSGMTYFPKELKIKVGDTVRWKNALDYHEKTARVSVYAHVGNKFRSSMMSYGEYFEYQFNETGTYTYGSVPYTEWFRRGTIIVE